MTHVIDKALRLLAEDRVTEHTDARVFAVLGDSATHITVLSDTGASCSCTAGQRHQICSHLVASRVLMDREQVAT